MTLRRASSEDAALDADERRGVGDVREVAEPERDRLVLRTGDTGEAGAGDEGERRDGGDSCEPTFHAGDLQVGDPGRDPPRPAQVHSIDWIGCHKADWKARDFGGPRQVGARPPAIPSRTPT